MSGGLSAKERRELGWAMRKADPWAFFVCKCAAELAASGWRLPKHRDWRPDPNCPYCAGFGIIPASLFKREWGWSLIEAGASVPCRTCIGRRRPAAFDRFLPDPTCPDCSGVGAWLIDEQDEDVIIVRLERD